MGCWLSYIPASSSCLMLARHLCMIQYDKRVRLLSSHVQIQSFYLVDIWLSPCGNQPNYKWQAQFWVYEGLVLHCIGNKPPEQFGIKVSSTKRMYLLQ